MARWLAIILPTFLLTCSTVLATPLTLEEALQKAKQQHPLLQTVQWDQAIAQASRRQADSGRYPQLDAQGGYTAQLDPQAMQVAGQSMETQQASYAFASLALTQTLYDFGRRDARQKQAQYGLKAVQSDIRSQEQEVVLQVIQTYFGLLEGEKLVLTAEQELRSVEEHRRVAQTLYEHGSVTRNDLLQAEVRHASSHQKLLASRNRLANLQLQLNFLIGSAPDEQSQLAEPPLPSQPPATPPALTEALENRPDLAALRSQLETSEQQVRASRAA
ncbi:MAG: TolC family protein, partial [Geobacter sp.]